jgi:hypothetical protein
VFRWSGDPLTRNTPPPKEHILSDNTDHTDAENFDSVPGMPSADRIRADLLKTGSPAYWRPHGEPDGTATDFASLGDAGPRVLQARMQTGPGPKGTAWQWAVWEHHKALAELDKEQARIEQELDAVKGYDPKTGEGLKAISQDRRKALYHLLANVVDERVRLEGEPGQAALDRKLDEAVRAEQRRFKQQYILSEANRRAAAKSMDDEIERLAANYAKTQPKP